MLFVDDWVRKQGFSSTEEYIEQTRAQSGVPNFDKVEYFYSFFENGLLRPGMIIRTSNMGMIDEHYMITKDGKLEGVTDTPAYPGRKGVFEPEEVLSGERISSGWTIESDSALDVLLRRYRARNKHGPGGI